MQTLIKNGTIVTASDQYVADILIEDEIIKSIGKNLQSRADETIDANGKYVFPGGIDGHVHLGQISSRGTPTTDFETTPAAIAGGTTTIITFSPHYDGLGLVESTIKYRQEQIEGKSAVDYGIHALIKNPQDKFYQEFSELVHSGIPTLKLFMALKGTPVHCDDTAVFTALRIAKKVGILAMVHAENSDIINVLQQKFLDEGKIEPKYHADSHPVVSEEEATSRATLLAKAAGAPIFVVHVSCIEAMQRIREARENGTVVFAETCPHYLTLTKDKLALPNFEGAKYVCAPPLRSERHLGFLWQALKEGWIQVVGSDHCAFNFKGQKEMGRDNFVKIPNGLPGIQDRLTILYTYGVMENKLSLMKMVDVWATTPAKLYGLYPQKGSIMVGADADLVIFDPKYEGKISISNSLQGVDYSLYEGFNQKGICDKVFLRGKQTFTSGKFTGQIGQGKFLKRSPSLLAY